MVVVVKIHRIGEVVARDSALEDAPYWAVSDRASKCAGIGTATSPATLTSIPMMHVAPDPDDARGPRSHGLARWHSQLPPLGCARPLALTVCIDRTDGRVQPHAASASDWDMVVHEWKDAHRRRWASVK